MTRVILATFLLFSSCNVFLELDDVEPVGGACSGLGDCDRGWQCVESVCVERAACGADGDCDNGLRCEAGFCFVVCETDVQCRGARTCQSGTCVSN